MPRLLGVTTESSDGSDEARQQDGMWTRYSSFTRVYLVLADSLSDNETAILATTGIPPLLYPLQGCFCKRRQPRERNQITHPVTGVLTALWEVSCEFDSQYDPQENQQQEDPTALRPEWEWDGEEREVPLEKDAITGDPVETKAWEKLIVPTYDLYHKLTITRYGRWPFDPLINHKFARRVNSKSFWGAPKGCALMKPVRARRVEVNGKSYSHETYTILFKIEESEEGGFLQDSWKARPLHQGHQFWELDEANEPVLRYTYDTTGGSPTVNLDDLGFRLENDADPVFLSFHRFKYVDFGLLNLGPF